MRRLAVESKRGLPETLTFVLDMKDDVCGSCGEMCYLLLSSLGSELCVMSSAAILYVCLKKSHKIIKKKSEIRSDYFPRPYL